jgi:triosephosphate isomerase (TIM)
MKRLVVGNWKLYIKTVAEGKKLLKEIDKKFPRGVKTEVVVCPPVFLSAGLRKEYRGKRIMFGTQDVFFEKEGAHTGQISPFSLASEKISHVIIGHSEMRAEGETDEVVAKKAIAAVSARLHPIICIGEKTRDTQGNFFSDIEKSVHESLSRLESAHANRITIAYEPVWAIGQAEAASPRVAAEAITYIRKTIADMWGREKALKVRIIYGGSVDAANAGAFAAEKTIQGLLPGRASADPQVFTDIIRAFG